MENGKVDQRPSRQRDHIKSIGRNATVEDGHKVTVLRTGYSVKLPLWRDTAANHPTFCK